jgi:polysaccharide export outer membrane protein
MIPKQLRKSVCVLLVLLFLSAWATCSVAQNESAVTPANNQPSSSKAVAVPIKIAAGDLVELSVFDAPELGQLVRVGADGNVQLALIGNTSLAGLTTQEAAEMIARKLRDGHFLLHPQVSVLVKEFATQGVSVMGEVHKPGVYQVLGPRSLFDVVSMAGGLTNVADTRITVKRRTGNQENVTVNLRNDDIQGSLANDVQIYPGDFILVPRAGIVYVLGDVNRPGGFVIQDKITLLQALAQAGGATTTAAVSKAVLLRRSGDGYVANKLHFDKIARAQETDLELLPNDVVFVPNNRLKNALRGAQGVASSIGSASIYAIVH